MQNRHLQALATSVEESRSISNGQVKRQRILAHGRGAAVVSQQSRNEAKRPGRLHQSLGSAGIAVGQGKVRGRVKGEAEEDGCEDAKRDKVAVRVSSAIATGV